MLIFGIVRISCITAATPATGSSAAASADLTDPDGRTKLDLRHNLLFPAFTAACSRVAEVIERWVRHGGIAVAD
jgi:hypothetical protein